MSFLNRLWLYVGTLLAKFWSESGLVEFAVGLRFASIVIAHFSYPVPQEMFFRFPWLLLAPFCSIWVVAGSIFDSISNSFLTKDLPFGARVCRLPAHNRGYPRQRDTTLQGTVRKVAAGSLINIYIYIWCYIIWNIISVHEVNLCPSTYVNKLLSKVQNRPLPPCAVAS